MPEDDPQRLFVAVTLPNALRETLATLPQKIAGVHWSPIEQWHLTLRFIGDVAAEQREVLRDRLRAVAVEPFVLPIEGVGTFPPGRPPRVVWVGTGSGHPRLFQLRQQVDDAILASGLDPDMRTFHPHVTLGRCTGPQTPGLAQWLHRHREFAGPPIRVDAFDLYRSELRPTGAIHTLVERFALKPRP
jgi:2'-5' RNA ligase